MKQMGPRGKAQAKPGKPNRKKKVQSTRKAMRFPERAGKDWLGPAIDYKEVDLLRKFLSSSAKLMSRKRAATNTQEQRDLKMAIKRARFMALLPFTGV